MPIVRLPPRASVAGESKRARSAGEEGSGSAPAASEEALLRAQDAPEVVRDLVGFDLDADEVVHHRTDAVDLFFDADRAGQGTLLVTSQRLVWLDGDLAAGGFAIDYPFITMHSVSQDASLSPLPCIYCHLNPSGDSDGPFELRLVPAESLGSLPDRVEELRRIFDAMSRCAEMNPDPLEEGDEDEGEEEDEEEGEEDGYFGDAAEDDEGGEGRGGVDDEAKGAEARFVIYRAPERGTGGGDGDGDGDGDGGEGVGAEESGPGARLGGYEELMAMLRARGFVDGTSAGTEEGAMPGPGWITANGIGADLGAGEGLEGDGDAADEGGAGGSAGGGVDGVGDIPEEVMAALMRGEWVTAEALRGGSGGEGGGGGGGGGGAVVDAGSLPSGWGTAATLGSSASSARSTGADDGGATRPVRGKRGRPTDVLARGGVVEGQFDDADEAGET